MDDYGSGNRAAADMPSDGMSTMAHVAAGGCVCMSCWGEFPNVDCLHSSETTRRNRDILNR